jgi:cytochrome c oxidase subunit 2
MGQLLLIGASSSRQAFGDLWAIYAVVAGVVFLAVVGLLAISLQTKAAGEPDRASSPRLEIAYTVALAVVAGLLIWRSFVAIDSAEPAALSSTTAGGDGRTEPTISVVASRWAWRFDYGAGVVQESGSLDRPTTLVVPGGKPVRFELRSRDVVHAFWVPAQRTKYDATPGRTHVFEMRFDEDVDYDSARCSEFCGTYHDLMTFNVRVLEPHAFETWLTQRREEAQR